MNENKNMAKDEGAIIGIKKHEPKCQLKDDRSSKRMEKDAALKSESIQQH